MKRLVISVIAMTISSYVLAGGDGQIVSERTELTGNAKDVHFTRSNDFCANYASTHARTYNANGQVNRNVRINSDHNYTITNYTAERKRYHFKYNLSAEDGDGTYHEGDVDVNAHGTWFDCARLDVVINKRTARYYSLLAATTIRGESTSEDHNSAVLTVR